MLITEQQTNMWVKMLKEEFGVTDTNKLSWVSEYATIHAIHESALGVQGTPASGQSILPSQGVSPMYATPLNTPGMGNPYAPGQPTVGGTNLGNFYAQTVGSGDVPVSTLPVALNVALLTIGLELVPVIPSKAPWILLSYMDFPYAGGKIAGNNTIVGIDGVGEGRENKPLYFKLIGSSELSSAIKEAGLDVTTLITITTDLGTVTGYYKTNGRMDGNAIFEVASCQDTDGNDASLKAVLEGATLSSITDVDTSSVTDLTVDVDYAQTQVDFIDGFANFATGEKRAMTRAENETGTGNTIGLRLFSKWVDMGAYEVTGQVTRQQLQDLPLMGVDAVSKVMEAMQNELTQHINARILDSVFAMGVTNALNQRAHSGVDLNLHMGTADVTMADTSISHYTDINGVDHKDTWGTITNVEVNTSAENLHTRQRRISSRILSAANLINVTGRRGRATWVVTNAKVATALQDIAGYIIAPAPNTLGVDASSNLYHAGTLFGLEVYVDPYMDWEDTRVCVGRKGSGNEPGLIFSPYILADQVTITAEGTMAPKMLINSRFAIAPIGFYPELMYYTFVVDSPEFEII